MGTPEGRNSLQEPGRPLPGGDFPAGESQAEADWTPLDFREAAARWRKKAEHHWQQSKQYDDLAVQERRQAERCDANAVMFERLVEEQTKRS